MQQSLFEKLGILMTEIEEYIATPEAVKEGEDIMANKPNTMHFKGLAVILLLAPNLKTVSMMIEISKKQGGDCDPIDRYAVDNIVN